MSSPADVDAALTDFGFAMGPFATADIAGLDISWRMRKAQGLSAPIADLWVRALTAARESGVVESGDRLVITAGTAVNIPGSTNVIKVDIA